MVRALAEAERALGRLAEVGRWLPNPHLLIRPFVRREAVLSSRIEGTETSLEDLFAYEAQMDMWPALSEEQGPKSHAAQDAREVANYVVALEYGLKRLSSLPMSLRLIRELHRNLMSGVRGQTRAPGEFRRVQNHIGPPRCRIEEATYVPPPVPDMTGALTALEKYLRAQTETPSLVRLALIHYHFEAIHPFLDGNGRVGRLLISLLLCAWGLLSEPLLYLSAFFERYRRDYYGLLLGVSQRGEWSPWILYFLRGVRDQADDAIERSNRLSALQQNYRARFGRTRVSARLLIFVDHLFGSPATTVTGAAKTLEITFRAAQRIIDRLVQAGILREITGARRNRLYLAEEILRTIDQPLNEQPQRPAFRAVDVTQHGA
jgi:Fic family protein